MIKTERLNGPNPDVDFDETLEEFRFKKDAALTKTTHKELAVGNINDSTGQVDPNFDVANDGTTTLRGFQWSYDSNNEELVFSDPDGIELMRHPKAGSTQFLQGIDVAFPFTAPEDGLTNFVNANNTTATSSGTTVGYTFSVDNQTVAQVSADSDGSGGIGNGKFVVRQAGGTAGTDEIQISYSGKEGLIKPASGNFSLGGNGNIISINDPLGPGDSDQLGRAVGSQQFGSIYFKDGAAIQDPNDNELLSFTSNSSAVNYLDVANAATGNAPTLAAKGGDAGVSLRLAAKGGVGDDVLVNVGGEDHIMFGVRNLYGSSTPFIQNRSGNNFTLEGFKAQVNIGTSNLSPVRFLPNRTEAARFDIDQNFLLGKTSHAADLFEAAGTVRAENGQDTVLYRGVNTNTSDELRLRTDASDDFLFQVEDSTGPTTRDIFRIDPSQSAQFNILGTLTVEKFNSSETVFEVNQNGSLVLSGGVTKGTTNLVSSDYTTTSTDYFIGVDTTTGAHAVTIRSADIEDGREIVIHDQGGNASGNNIQVQTEGSETISGAQYGSDLSSITMDTDHESVTLRGAIDNQSTGETNLYVV